MQSLKTLCIYNLSEPQTKNAISIGVPDVRTTKCQQDVKKCKICEKHGLTHLSCLEHGCTFDWNFNKVESLWNHLSCHGAVQLGHLDCIRYAHRHGAPVSLVPASLLGIITRDDVDLLSYFYTLGSLDVQKPFKNLKKLAQQFKSVKCEAFIIQCIKEYKKTQKKTKCTIS